MNNDIIKYLNPNVYREATKYIIPFPLSPECCCGAISIYCLAHKIKNYDDYISFFAYYFKPPHKDFEKFWWESPIITLKDQPARSFALLLAAEILNSEQNKKC